MVWCNPCYTILLLLCVCVFFFLFVYLFVCLFVCFYPKLIFFKMFIDYLFWETFITDPVKIGCSCDLYGKKIAFFSVFLPFWRTWRHSDITRKLIVHILVDMDIGNQDLYRDTKHRIILHSYYIWKIYGDFLKPTLVSYVSKTAWYWDSCSHYSYMLSS